MGAVRLTRVNCVLGHANTYRRKSGKARGAVITSQEKSEVMTIERKYLLRVKLVLLAIFRESKKSIATRNLQARPGIVAPTLQIPSANQVIVAAIAGELHNWLQAWPEAVGDRQIHRMIAVPHIISARIGFDIAYARSDQQVGICITIAMRICREIIGKKKIANPD